MGNGQRQGAYLAASAYVDNRTMKYHSTGSPGQLLEIELTQNLKLILLIHLHHDHFAR